MPDLIVERQRHTTILTINRPESMNSLTLSLINDLEQALAEFQSDASQYVAVITGTGDKAFSAGGDLKEVASNVAAGTRMPIRPGADIGGLAACEKVTIAAVNGLAVSGGLEMAISCDIRIASTSAWFGAFEVKRGMLAGVATSVLPRLLPLGTAMDLLLSTDRLSAEEAHLLGLVQRVVPPEALIETALAKADMIAANSQAAVRGTKQVLKFWRNALLAEQQRYYEAVSHRVLLSGDVGEGALAFAEKRAPAFANAWPDPFSAAQAPQRDNHEAGS